MSETQCQIIDLEENLNLVETSVPIPIEDLKRSFVEKDIVFAVDYAKSRLKGKAFLAYISNLNVNVRLRLEEGEEKYHLIGEYMRLPLIVNLLEMELHVIEILLTYKGLLPSNEVKAKILTDNEEIIEEWVKRLDSLVIYPYQTMLDGDGPICKDDIKAELDKFPSSDEDTAVGINFVQLLKHHDFFAYYQVVNKANICYYKAYFTENLFKGAPLFAYWANNGNPLYLSTIAVLESVLEDEPEET